MTKPNPSRQPIAVVGVSALFPGTVDTTGYWHDILAGTDRMTDVPASHWLIDDHYDADQAAPDKTYGRRGGFLDPVDLDVMGFGIPPVAVPVTDTAQLLALIVADRVLDDAVTGQFAELDRSRTSVILGVTSGQELLGAMASRMNRPLWLQGMRRAGVAEDVALAACEQIADLHPEWQESTFPGLLGNVVAGRIANRLDLGGTNCVTDAACASSFSALSMGVNELYLGDSDMVIAGGVDTMNDIFMYMCFSKTPALSPSEDIRPFSDQADGTMLGEGLGMVALKRLDDAERDGNHIYCVINGIGASSDGRSKSVYAPVSEGQARALANAYDKAEYGPDTVELVEAHGTGTVAGDAAEFGGLELAFDASGRTDRQWCALGSVKSQIGHTKAAAGAAGLVKVIMALHHKVLPQTAKIDKPNPKLDLEASPFHLNTRTRPWVRGEDHERRGSVSSFGFGGSNFHVVMSEYQGTGVRAPRLRTADSELVVLTATDAVDLVSQAREHHDRASEDGYLVWLARTSQEGYHAEAGFRLALVAEGEADLQTKLASAVERIESDPQAAFSMPTGVHYGVGTHEGDIAFVFPGQGSQYLFMGADLAMAFDEAIAPWDAASGLGWGEGPLHTVVYPVASFDEATTTEQNTKLTATEWAQPAIGATSLGQLRLLAAIGVKPRHVAGHSFGEITALHAAGVLSESDMLNVARRRGELMAEAARVASAPGSMTAVSADIDQVRAAVETSGINVVVANHNHPSQVVVSGETSAIEAFEVALGGAGMAFTRLPVATAFHSPLVSSASEAFTDYLKSIDFAQADVAVYANETAQTYPENSDQVREQLGNQLAKPVRFVEMVERMYEQGARTFIEVGPGTTLTGLVGRILGDAEHRAVALDKKKGKGLAPFFKGLAQLVACGVPMDLGRLWDAYGEPTNPHDLVAPRLTLAINGANFDSPYPPKDLTELVGPNPSSTDAPHPAAPAPTVNGLAAAAESSASTTGTISARQVEPAEPAEPVHPGQSTHGLPLSPAPAAPSEAAPTTDRSEVMVTNQNIDPAAPAANGVAASPNGVLPPAAVPGVVAAYLAVMQNTAEAHAEYLRSTAAAHSAFLTMAQQGIAILSSSVAASPVSPMSFTPVALPTPAPLPVTPVITPVTPVTSVTVAPVAAPVSPPPAPAPVVQAAPAPVAAAAPATVAVAPAAPAVAPVQAAPQTPAAAPAPAAPAAAGEPALSSDDLMALLLSVVSDCTGYPSEMLTMEMELEGDLGIDSIKRVEILSAMQDQVPSLPEVDTAVMAELVTLGQIVDYMFGQMAGGDTPPFDQGLAALKVAAEPEALGRFITAAVAAPAAGLAMLGLDAGVIAITDDGTGVAPLLAELLKAAGQGAVVVGSVDEIAAVAGLAGLVVLDGLRMVEDVETASGINHAAFSAARALAGAIDSPALFVTVSNLGGDFGITGVPGVQAWSSGLPALARTAAIEWPATNIKAIDLCRASSDAATVAQALANELLAGGPEAEVGLGADGSRITLTTLAEVVEAGPLPLGPSDVVVVSGGARGVTAATMVELARASGATFVMLGRSVLEAEPASCVGAESDAALKKVFLAEATADGEKVTPAQLARRSGQVLAGREVRATLAAIEGVGAAAHYRAVDITDSFAVAQTMAAVRSEIGPITGLVHGAGVLADKLIAEKTDEAFDRVFRTKVDGLRALLDATSGDELKLLCLFSSVAARTGNQGQVDYAMANEVLNKVAVAERVRRGPDCVVKALGWGPWDGGMVTPALKAHFEAMGTSLIPIDEGSRMLVAEISSGQRDQVELVLGAGVTPDHLAVAAT